MGRTISSHVLTLNRAPPSGHISDEKTRALQYVTPERLFTQPFSRFVCHFRFSCEISTPLRAIVCGRTLRPHAMPPLSCLASACRGEGLPPAWLAEPTTPDVWQIEKNDMIRIELSPCVTIYMSDEMIHVYVEDENGRTCLHGNAVSVFIGQYSFGINIYFDEMYVGKYWRGY